MDTFAPRFRSRLSRCIGDLSGPVVAVCNRTDLACLINSRVHYSFSLVGYNSTASKKVDIRVIAATNAGLSAKTDAKLFRSDLYYRLSSMIIWIPPLRDRTEDIFPIAEYYLNEFAATMRVPTPELTPEAVTALEGYALPGNVRELMNIIESALIVSEGAAIQPKHLRFRSPDAEVLTPPATGIDAANPLPPAAEVMLAEQEQIRRALAENRGNITKTARQLGLSRYALYRRLKKYGFR